MQKSCLLYSEKRDRNGVELHRAITLKQEDAPGKPEKVPTSENS